MSISVLRGVWALYRDVLFYEISMLKPSYKFVIFSGRSGEAVGLSAISFSAALQKDAAPIPNALAAIKTKQNPRNPEIR